MKTIIIFFLPIILLGIVNCDTNEPPPPPDGEKPTLELTLDNANNHQPPTTSNYDTKTI